MSNMSYCRFQNTFPDLKDCVESLQWEVSISDLPKLEKDCALKMRELCEQYLELTEIKGENV